MRDKQRRSLNVTVEELDLDAEAGTPAGRREDTAPRPEETGFGMTIEPVSPEIARETQLPKNRGGAVISSVERRSPAANAGLAPGDIILEVNRQAVNNPSQVTRALQASPAGQPVFLVVWREGAEVFVALTKR